MPEAATARPACQRGRSDGRAVRPPYLPTTAAATTLGCTPTRATDMLLHPAAWTILIIAALVVVWFTSRDDDPPDR